MAVSDYQAGKVITRLPVAAGVDGVDYDAKCGDAFASNANGTLTVIHADSPDEYHVVEKVKTQEGHATWVSIVESSHLRRICRIRRGAHRQQVEARGARVIRDRGDRAHRRSEVNRRARSPAPNPGDWPDNSVSPVVNTFVLRRGFGIASKPLNPPTRCRFGRGAGSATRRVIVLCPNSVRRLA